MIRMIAGRDIRSKNSLVEAAESSDTDRQRVLLAELCRTWGRQMASKRGETPNNGRSVAVPWEMPANQTPPVSGSSAMAPRHQQTLDLLLHGDAEKQIAGKLGLSRHTVHDYVKAIYRRFGVNSRGELLALWVRK